MYTVQVWQSFELIFDESYDDYGDYVQGLINIIEENAESTGFTIIVDNPED